jgi:methionyl-tRNA formyltransferase
MGGGRKIAMSGRKCRVALFGSFYRGFYLLNELLLGRLSEQVTVVGVATDDPDGSHVSAQRRVWQYPHTPYEKHMVAELAREHALAPYGGKVNSPEFYEIFEGDWKPDLCVMGTFGQRIGKRLIDAPTLGFYNLHPCIDDAWPSKYIGGNPFEALMQDGHRYCCVVLHGIDEGFDTGPFVARTDRIALPSQTTVTDMHKISSFAAAQLASQEIGKIILANRRAYG